MCDQLIEVLIGCFYRKYYFDRFWPIQFGILLNFETGKNIMNHIRTCKWHVIEYMLRYRYPHFLKTITNELNIKTNSVWHVGTLPCKFRWLPTSSSRSQVLNQASRKHLPRHNTCLESSKPLACLCNVVIITERVKVVQ